MFLARSPRGHREIPVRRSAGRYRISAAAYAEASLLGRNVSRIMNGTPLLHRPRVVQPRSRPATLRGRNAALHPGDLVGVVLHTAANDPVAVSQLLSVAIEPDPKPVQPDEGRSHYVAFFDFVVRSKKYNPEVPAGPTPVPGHAALTPYYGMGLWTQPGGIVGRRFSRGNESVSDDVFRQPGRRRFGDRSAFVRCGFRHRAAGRPGRRCDAAAIDGTGLQRRTDEPGFRLLS